MPSGRLPEYTEEIKKKLLKKFNKYIDETDIPILAEFAYRNSIYRQRLYEFFPDASKRLSDKKMAALERKSLEGNVNVTQAIFSLKQMGWSDRARIEHAGDKDNPVMVSIADIMDADTT